MKLQHPIHITKMTILRTLLTCTLLSVSHVANAVLNFQITETTEGVLIQGSGSIDTSLLELVPPPAPSAATLNQGFIFLYHDALGVGSGPVLFYTGGAFTGPEAFGTGPTETWDGAFATSNSGDPIVFDIYEEYVVLPSDYVSNSALNGTAFFEGATFDSLALYVGNYSWTDSAGTEINLTIVPEPSAYSTLFGLTALLLCCTRRKVKRSQLN